MYFLPIPVSENTASELNDVWSLPLPSTHTEEAQVHHHVHHPRQLILSSLPLEVFTLGLEGELGHWIMMGMTCKHLNALFAKKGAGPRRGVLTMEEFRKYGMKGFENLRSLTLELPCADFAEYDSGRYYWYTNFTWKFVPKVISHQATNFRFLNGQRNEKLETVFLKYLCISPPLFRSFVRCFCSLQEVHLEGIHAAQYYDGIDRQPKFAINAWEALRALEKLHTLHIENCDGLFQCEDTTMQGLGGLREIRKLTLKDMAMPDGFTFRCFKEARKLRVVVFDELDFSGVENGWHIRGDDFSDNMELKFEVRNCWQLARQFPLTDYFSALKCPPYIFQNGFSIRSLADGLGYSL